MFFKLICLQRDGWYALRTRGRSRASGRHGPILLSAPTGISGAHRPGAFPAGWPQRACVIALSWEETELRAEIICKRTMTVSATNSPAPNEMGSLSPFDQTAVACTQAPGRAAFYHACAADRGAAITCVLTGAGHERPRLLVQLRTRTGTLLTLPASCTLPSHAGQRRPRRNFAGLPAESRVPGCGCLTTWPPSTSLGGFAGSFAIPALAPVLLSAGL